MESYYIQSTEFTPEIDFNPTKGVFSIKGISRPENVVQFYMPALTWLKEFTQNVQNNPEFKKEMSSLQFVFQLSYFNSSSSKLMIQMLDALHIFRSMGLDVNIDWYYDKTDEQMKEDGEDLSSALEIPFNYFES